MTTPTGYTENDIDGLTPEEIEALAEDDGAGDKTTLGESIGDEGDDDTAGTAAADAAAAATAAAAAEAAKVAAAKTGKTDETTDTTPVETVAKVEPAKPLPLFVVDAPANADADLKAISEKKGSLLDQFDNGDITAKEYQTQLDGLNREERKIENAVEKANTATEMNQQQEKNAWLGQVQAFTTTDHPEYSTSKSRWLALDSFVKEIANDPANAQLSGPQILAKAHEAVVADLGAVAGAANTAVKIDPKTNKPVVDDKAGRPLKGAKVVPPVTLQKVPATDNVDLNDTKFAALDRLGESNPLALEDKLMSMSAADRDEYLSSRTD
ncbi:hypothetical protein M0D69_13940 [Caballeronia sp. SEWSISQ10-4 2]|uniref:hypothetical protein n=1 Tax=Caballeronia sp. SEWSISQ10-4 2 TaxID=2937438 RepID=UPI00264D5272|nr:hypothetical protein [Caballeronia sp. SEWSISQ10-4 2]MDN7179095.1 hypothetical protein [Caballeronia sp. SEWSISQ10-4 2]